MTEHTDRHAEAAEADRIKRERLTVLGAAMRDAVGGRTANPDLAQRIADRIRTRIDGTTTRED